MLDYYIIIVIILLIFINLLFGFTIDGVDNFAHAGGLFSGLICGWILSPKVTREILTIPSEIPTYIEQKTSTIGSIKKK